MLMTREQMKYLVPTEREGVYTFIGADKANDDEKKELLRLDMMCVEVYGRHLVTNPDELK